MTKAESIRYPACPSWRASSIQHRFRPARRRFSLSRGSRGFTLPKRRERVSAFTLLELLIVIGIIGVLVVLTAPAFTYLKGGTDVTSAAYTIKGVLDTARTYAKANNTYTWVGFYEENVENPASPNTSPPPIGRVIMSIVASKDGTNIATGGQMSSASLIQVGKPTRLENVHLAAFADGSGQAPGDTFATRPPVTFNGMQYSLAGMADSTSPFSYPAGSPYTFSKAVQFSPRGEAVIGNSAQNSLQTAAEIGVQPTHGITLDSRNPVAIQFTGIGGNVKIYRK